MSNYVYECLDKPNNIRLLDLQSGSPLDQVSVSLLKTTIDSAPEYEAVSYTWGDTLQKCVVNVDGQDLEVFGNSYEALTELRYPDQNRIIWIDALCINQNDPDEKSWQIMLMGDLYKNAHRVIVWLCGPRHKPHEAIEMINRLWLACWDPEFDPNRIKDLPEFDPALQDSMHWDALKCFYCHPWVSRSPERFR